MWFSLLLDKEAFRKKKKSFMYTLVPYTPIERSVRSVRVCLSKESGGCEHNNITGFNNRDEYL